MTYLYVLIKARLVLVIAFLAILVISYTVSTNSADNSLTQSLQGENDHQTHVSQASFSFIYGVFGVGIIVLAYKMSLASVKENE